MCGRYIFVVVVIFIGHVPGVICLFVCMCSCLTFVSGMVILDSE